MTIAIEIIDGVVVAMIAGLTWVAIWCIYHT